MNGWLPVSTPPPFLTSSRYLPYKNTMMSRRRVKPPYSAHTTWPELMHMRCWGTTTRMRVPVTLSAWPTSSQTRPWRHSTTCVPSPSPSPSPISTTSTPPSRRFPPSKASSWTSGGRARRAPTPIPLPYRRSPRSRRTCAATTARRAAPARPPRQAPQTSHADSARRQRHRTPKNTPADPLRYEVCLVARDPRTARRHLRRPRPPRAARALPPPHPLAIHVSSDRTGALESSGPHTASHEHISDRLAHILTVPPALQTAVFRWRLARTQDAEILPSVAQLTARTHVVNPGLEVSFSRLSADPWVF
ncbi:hypothetical protein B0H14DRAFT_372101 [Mycena olivaceomarginata]|nr:hypothetical protein B0H14DRAFT_372101 [Mycena olivaceomarginata]